MPTTSSDSYALLVIIFVSGTTNGGCDRLKWPFIF
jgi:hypothetical protein